MIIPLLALIVGVVIGLLIGRKNKSIADKVADGANSVKSKIEKKIGDL